MHPYMHICIHTSVYMYTHINRARAADASSSLRSAVASPSAAASSDPMVSGHCLDPKSVEVFLFGSFQRAILKRTLGVQIKMGVS